ncbi:MAG: 50S ribosomal protein L32 [Pseudomonadota bacterium]
MAVPKRKVTPSKRNQRRSHDRLGSANLHECPNCGELKLPHHICPKCNYYHGREILQAS